MVFFHGIARLSVLIALSVLCVCLVRPNGSSASRIEKAIFRKTIAEEAIGEEVLNTTNATQQAECFSTKIRVSNLPRPFINLGLPKSGSSSLQNFFKCGGFHSVHHDCRGGTPCGRCSHASMQGGSGLGLNQCSENADALMQIDVTAPEEEHGCFWPQVSALEAVHQENPHATILLPQRNAEAWVRSVENWERNFPLRIQQCGLIPSERELTATNQSRSDALLKFYCEHIERIRQFVKEHPTHILVEFDIADSGTGSFLAGLFGVDPKCWEQMNATNKTKGESYGRDQLRYADEKWLPNLTVSHCAKSARRD